MSKFNSTSLPHSWSIEDWPRDVFPGSPTKGRYLVRMYRSAMLEAGALARVGRSLVVIGARYGRWLEKSAAHVADFEIAPNRRNDELSAP